MSKLSTHAEKHGLSLQLDLTHPACTWSTSGLIHARLTKRENRYRARVVLPSGESIAAFVPDPGRLGELMIPGAEVGLLAATESPGRPPRKTAHDLVLVRKGDIWVSVDQRLSNRWLGRALSEGAFKFKDAAGSYHYDRSEVPMGQSRFDFRLKQEARTLILEVKGASLVENGVCRFPDAPTVRGTRHLRELTALNSKNTRAAVLVLAKHGAATVFEPHQARDAAFASAWQQADAAGLPLFVVRASFTPQGGTLQGFLPWRNPVDSLDLSDHSNG